MKHATKACELTSWEWSAFIDTLAAANAEAGDFESAADWQQKAIDLDPNGFFTDEFESRLELYKSGQAYRETPAEVTGFDMEGWMTAPDSAVES